MKAPKPDPAKPQTSDRVSVSIGRKISDDAWGSYDYHYSYSTDVASDETVEQAQERAEDVVLTRLRERIKEVSERKKARKAKAAK